MSVPQVPPPQAPRPPLGVLRGIVATVGVIIMVFAGGCTLLFVGSMFTDSSGGEFAVMGLAVGAVPFLFGALLTWLALKAGR